MAWKYFIIVILLLLSLSCSILSSNSESTSSDTNEQQSSPTSTEMAVGIASETPDIVNLCDGLSGQFELQLLVGPAEVAGLEPVAVGGIPFTVVWDEDIYTVEGSNAISYEDILIEEWGTYTVTFDMDVTVTGQCNGQTGAEQLTVEVNMTGNQLVVVESEGFTGEYPWEGTHTQDLTFPIEEGASAEGEGWQMVLHLNQ